MQKVSNLRNFCIIAHIDHGKSTLADRMLELTGTVSSREIKDRTLDTLELEQERGITIKLQTARMKHTMDGEEYVLNLIDTPGHVDFSYEVSRSVAACEGALLLVDATQGIQAQTLSTLYEALNFDLKIIPVLNKVDLPNADVDRVKLEIMEVFGVEEEEILLASGKTGEGVAEILDEIVKKVPAPDMNEGQQTRALVFDSFFHEYKGVIALVKVVAGSFTHQQQSYLIGTDVKLRPVEIGYLSPKLVTQQSLNTGEVGYIATGLKDIKLVHVGDTVTTYDVSSKHLEVEPLMGYQAPKPMVYASLYPVEASDFDDFQDALEKLALNDSALTYQREFSQALGTGFLCGFLGLLHLEIVQERLSREFNIDLISTMPTVEFRLDLTTKDLSKIPNINASNVNEDGQLTVRTASEFPDQSLINSVYEPWVRLELFSPEEYIGGIMELCQSYRGVYKNTDYSSSTGPGQRHAVLKYEIPTLEIMVNFFDKLKSLSHGYASMDYTPIGYQTSDIVKVSILVNEVEAEALSFLTHRSNAERRGRGMVEKLGEIIPRQQFKVPIQAAIGGKVLARTNIKAFRKDVTSKLYGGDETRKRKLLEKQKKGKKKMKEIGSVQIPKEAFLAALKVE